MSWKAADLEARFAEGPDPERACERAAALLEAAGRADRARLRALQRECAEPLWWVLEAICGVAPFLQRFLERHPHWLLELAEDSLQRARSLEEYEARLDRALFQSPSEEAANVLRRFKYYELARITTRDCSEACVPLEDVGETLGELSALAETVLRAALGLAAQGLAEEAAPPLGRRAGGAPAPLRFSVLGLGKLGGEELNYASDVDLVYVYESAAAIGGGPGDLSPPEYFTQLATRFGRLVERTSEEGFLYRIDLDLRPEGAQGPLVVSSDALAQYYDGWAASWEKAAFMKARPVAGDLDFGWRVAREIDPMIYQSSVDYRAVEGIREMKEKVEASRRAARDDVKLGPGGIRDVEFVAQALQLLHGGRMPQVRGRSAPRALRALAAVGALAREEAETLEAAYRFLRRVENRLQMQAERQTHQLPAPGPARTRLARTLGFRGADAEDHFDSALRAQRTRVREHFDALFRESPSDRVLDLFLRHAPKLVRQPQTRSLIEDLAQRFATAVAESADPERAMNSLDRFLEGVGSRTFYYGLLLDRPELVPRLATLFGASRYLSAFFATHPQLIEPVFRDPEHLIPSLDELHRSLAALAEELGRRGDRDEEEVGLAALRLFMHRELVNVGLLDLSGKIEAPEVERALTDIADVCLEEALALARHQLARQRPDDAARVEAGEFLVVGMGKLGSRELSYGSDLDVIFLYDVRGDEMERARAQQPFVLLAQKLGWALQTRTAEGVCYEVDARLRPSGRQGMLVTSLASFERYHEKSAQIWERQALLRARPVAGSPGLGEAFGRLRDEILRRPLEEDPTAEIHRLRQRVEEELAREGGGRRNLKSGRGGLVDVETIVQLLQIKHGPSHPALLGAERTETLLERIEALGLLSIEDVATLREGWAFLQRLASRLRVVENRSISDLSEERADLDSVARALGYATSARTGSARLPLLESYRRHTEAIRRVYERVFADIL